MKRLECGVEEKKPCKNLEAERRRRKKLSDHLLALRSIVPNITNMTKATIIQDAITYIHTLENNVDLLTQQLLEFDEPSPSPPVIADATSGDQYQVNAAEDMMPRVKLEENIIEVSKISEKKLWIKIITEKEKGGFSKIMEALTQFGFELTDTTATTCNGTFLFSSFLQGRNGVLGVEQTKEHLLQMVRGI